jgi:hypothetical protein
MSTPHRSSQDPQLIGAEFSALRSSSQSLSQDHSKTTEKLGKSLDETNILVFPWNVAERHWIAVELDISQRTIRLGDPLPSFTRLHLEKVIENLLAWLKIYLPTHTWCFEPTGLPIMKQEDSISCGPAVIDCLLTRYCSSLRDKQRVADYADGMRVDLFLQVVLLLQHRMMHGVRLLPLYCVDSH